jgi:hypothetical protein
VRCLAAGHRVNAGEQLSCEVHLGKVDACSLEPIEELSQHVVVAQVEGIQQHRLVLRVGASGCGASFG